MEPIANADEDEAIAGSLDERPTTAAWQAVDEDDQTATVVTGSNVERPTAWASPAAGPTGQPGAGQPHVQGHETAAKPD